MEQRQYLCIDQKSYYATVECVARGLDPMTTDLVVADPERSENTICYLQLKMSSRYHNIVPRLNMLFESLYKKVDFFKLIQ